MEMRMETQSITPEKLMARFTELLLPDDDWGGRNIQFMRNRIVFMERGQ